MKNTLLLLSVLMTLTQSALAQNTLSGSLVGSLTSEQWALENRGNSFKIDIDDITTIDLPGLAGEDIGVSRAHPEPKLDKPIIVAVLDTGVDYTHPDLDGALLEKPEECKAMAELTKCSKLDKKEDVKACEDKWQQVDTDHNGYPLDCVGYNVTTTVNPITGIKGSSEVMDQNGHGTHIAGILAALNKQRGILGISRNIKILPVKVITAAPTEPVRPESLDDVPTPIEKDHKWSQGFVDTIARGVIYAIRSGAQIINLSMGWPRNVDTQLMRDAIKLAQAKGILVVAASGNDSTDALISPCNYPGVICVASHDPDGKISYFSNYGAGVDIAAPGLKILSTWPLAQRQFTFTDKKGYEFKNGTSMATPYVAGVLARLLADGYSPSEAYARMMLGARPSQPAKEKFTLSGNVDLARAENVTAQTLILPEVKSEIRLAWDRVSDDLNLPLDLQNFWSSAQNVTIDFEMANATDEVAIVQPSVSFANWKQGESKKINLGLRVLNPKLRSDLIVRAKVTANGQKLKGFLLSFEVYVPVSADSQFGKKLNLPADTSFQNSSIRTVTGLGEYTKDVEYIAIDNTNQQQNLRLIRLTQNAAQILSSAQIAVPEGNLLLIQKARFLNANSASYVLIYKLGTSDTLKQGGMRFDYYDQNLKLIKSVNHSNDKSVLVERFQWMSLGGQLTPVWLTRGYTPDLEAKKFDPWDQDYKDTPDVKVYYLAQDGLRSVKLDDEDQYFIEMLNNEKLGETYVVIGKGVGYDTEYTLAKVSGGKLTDQRPLQLAEFRQLQALSVFSMMNETGDKTSTVFVGDSQHGGSRMTALSSLGVVNDTILKTDTITDSVRTIVGAFDNSNKMQAFSQTIYNLQFHDMTTGQMAKTSLRRFSFMPGVFFFRTFFPMMLQTDVGSEPGVYIPGGIGLSSSIEMVVPDYQGSQLVGLKRPASLRLEGAQDCQMIANPTPKTETTASQFVFFCKNKVLLVPAQY